MKADRKSTNSTPILIGFSLLLIGIAQITALWTFARILLPTITQSQLEEVQPAKFSPQIYQLEVVDNRIRLRSKAIYTSATSPQMALVEAMEELLAQSSTFNSTTTIPPGTRLLALHTSKDGIHVNLSREFTQGGGSSSMIYRVAQVLYTATSIDPQMPVFFSIEGQPLNEDNPLGGEGLLLQYPITRQQFDQDFLTEQSSFEH
ncbi:GerMN domain-containing protein [Pleurocapsales cyanobacterium LEGE 10410]|nr:GerMN domain-containing protein [Pleurocapsales cyanobacterium LEGE 10410]